MRDRNELLEAALDELSDGLMLAGAGGRIEFWNRNAEEMTGHSRSGLLGRGATETMGELFSENSDLDAESELRLRQSGFRIVLARHRMGREFPAVVRSLVLRDGLGAQIGTGLIFHPARSLNTVPHGESGGDKEIGESQMALEERLTMRLAELKDGGLPMGLMWVKVDQGPAMRSTHGARACEAMMERMEAALRGGIRANEELGRWGESEFLVISHEPGAAELAGHAYMLGRLARTAEFRWWGDRVSLSVSIGAAQATASDSASELLERAQKAMQRSVNEGGNRATSADGRKVCLQS